MTSIVRQYSTTKVRRESAADFSSRLQLNVPEITIMSHRPSFVDINSEVTRSRTNSRINITRRVTDIPQRANAANESPSFDNNGEENADRDRSTSITLNAEDDVADHVMFGSGELNVHLDTLTWINAPWKLSALVGKHHLLLYRHMYHNPYCTTVLNLCFNLNAGFHHFRNRRIL